MDGEKLEVECPLCDHKISVDATRCPNCQAVFTLSDVEELQRVAREINDPATADRPSVDPLPADGVADPADGAAERKEKAGLFGKLFKKKR